jgi:capsule polysaccharide export protein KpsE/RkpR
MATRNVIKRSPGYPEPELERGIIRLPQQEERGRTVERARTLWNERKTLYRWTVIGMVASAVIAFVLPPRYTTTTRLMPPDQASQGLASMMAVLGKNTELGSLGTELFGVKTSGDLFMGVLKSQTVENAIINKFDLRTVYGEKRYQDARKKLESRTDLTADRKSGIITIKVSDGDPQRAAQMGQEYVEELNRVVVSVDTSSAHRERVFLESRLKEVEQDLQSAEKDFSQFASKNAALDVKEQGRAMIGAEGTLEGQLIAAQTELEGLLQIYTSNNVRVRSLQARVDEYKRQLQKLGGQTTGEGTETSAVNNANPGDDLYPSIRKLPILGVTWADLYRRTKVEEAVFETLTKQYEMARVEEAREVPTVKVLDAADVPERKSSPPRLIIMLFGTLFVAAMGGVWILASKRWDELDANDPGKKLGEEMLQSFRSTSKEISGNVSRRFWHRNGNGSV